MSSYNLLPGQSVLGPQGTKAAFAWTVFFTVLAPSAVALRFYAKRIKRRPPWWDDWVLVTALIFYLGNLSGIYATIFVGGLGHHAVVVTPAGITVINKVSIIIRWVYISEMFLIRSSICLFLWRTFPIRRIQIGVLIASGINLSWLIFGFFYVGFLCQPFAFNWDKTIPGGKCLDRNDWYSGVFGWEIAIDAIIWFLPISSVWEMRIPRAQKVFITGIFALGALDIAVAIIRIVVVHRLDFDDLTYYGVAGSIWSLAEPAIGIVVASAPLYKSIIDKIIPASWRDTIRYKLSGGQSAEKGASYYEYNAQADPLNLVPATREYADGGGPVQESGPPSSSTQPNDEIVVKRDVEVMRMA